MPIHYRPDYMLLSDGTIKSSMELSVSDDGHIVSIHEATSGNDENTAFTLFEGLLLPGLINSHCHLELSWSKGLYPEKAGMETFYGAMSGIHARRPDDNIAQTAIQDAINELINNGTVAVCDISNTALTLSAKQTSPVIFHTFLECFGTNPAEAFTRIKNILDVQSAFKRQNQRCSLSAHTLFTLSDALRSLLMTKIVADGEVHSIHFMESLAEKRFFETGTPITNIHRPEAQQTTTYVSAAEAACTLLPRENKILFVHNTYAREQEIQRILSHFTDPWFCLCPASNQYINNALPDVPMMLSNTSKILIGTDGYSSNTELNLFSEIDILLAAYPTLSVESMLMAATLNGAVFMGIEEQLGSLGIHKKPGLTGLEHYRPGIRKLSSLKVKRLL